MDSPPASPGERLADLERRLRRDPGSPLFAPLAELYRAAGRLDDAERVLREGLVGHPDHHSASASLGRVLVQQGKIDEARRLLEEVVSRVPDNLLAVRLLGEIGRQAAGAAAGAQRAEAVRPAVPPQRTEPAPRGGDELVSGTLAEIYLAQGDRERGLAILRELARREPDNAHWLGRIRQVLGPSAAVGARVLPPPVPEPLPEEIWQEGQAPAENGGATTLALVATPPAPPQEAAAPLVPAPPGVAEAPPPGRRGLAALRRFLEKVERARRRDAV